MEELIKHLMNTNQLKSLNEYVDRQVTFLKKRIEELEAENVTLKEKGTSEAQYERGINTGMIIAFRSTVRDYELINRMFHAQ